MTESAKVLFANEAFYQAFRDRDIAAMGAVWAETLPVACLHPGWQLLTGRAEVMASWTAILANPEAPAIRCRGARALLYGESALVLCYEVLGQQYLAASNYFAKEAGQWRLVHHQAGPCPKPDDLPEESEESTPAH